MVPAISETFSAGTWRLTDSMTNLTAYITGLCLSAAAGLCAGVEPASAQLLEGPGALFLDQTPIEMMASNYSSFETGYLLPRGAVYLQVGSDQTTAGSGTGTEVYTLRGDWAVADWLQVSAFGHAFDDPPLCGTSACADNLTFLAGGGGLKLGLVESYGLSIAASGSLETLYLSGDLYGNEANGNWEMAGSLQLPMSLTVTDSLRFHLTPGVSFLPETVNGVPYYGTIPYVGAGLTWQPITGLQSYATVMLPYGTDGNALSSSGGYEVTPVWLAGVKLAVTPKAAVDIFATNGWGQTPATSILAFPGNDEIAYGIRLSYTPWVGVATRDVYFDSYRVDMLSPVTQLEQARQFDGLTLTSANTLTPHRILAEAGIGSRDFMDVHLGFSPDQDLQLDAIFSQYPGGGMAGDAVSPWGDEWAYMAGGKLRLMDQNYGDLFSLAGQVLAGRDFNEPTTGIIYASLPASLDLSDAVSVAVEPKFAAYGDERLKAIGGGVTVRPLRDLALIGEVTAVLDGGDPVWAGGARYALPNTPFSADAYVTNATGLHGVGTMLAQDEARYGLTLRFAY
ncbi:hypothetical protein Mame_01964 [Martelella mediterranea DSM 17316]|uniref:Uncharacterized protein n=2 Tax=Martelella mediterranea TaxID=293089 RepID=A0A1U9Z0T3_9HYPH|nr:hypothetical protein Mame_01964 [Martelella mediterranea DSM 17316]